MIYRFDLDLPPTLNDMLEAAKKGRHGIMYRNEKNLYIQRARIMARSQHRRPPEPHAKWKVVSVTMRRHNLADPIEAMAALKWPIDMLVREGYFADDSPRELIDVPLPLQMIERRKKLQGLVIVCEGLAP